MADHVPRLCRECRLPLSANEKRQDRLRCTWHRELKMLADIDATFDFTAAGEWVETVPEPIHLGDLG